MAEWNTGQTVRTHSLHTSTRVSADHHRLICQRCHQAGSLPCRVLATTRGVLPRLHAVECPTTHPVKVTSPLETITVNKVTMEAIILAMVALITEGEVATVVVNSVDRTVITTVVMVAVEVEVEVVVMAAVVTDVINACALNITLFITCDEDRGSR